MAKADAPRSKRLHGYFLRTVSQKDRGMDKRIWRIDNHLIRDILRSKTFRLKDLDDKEPEALLMMRTGG